MLPGVKLLILFNRIAFIYQIVYSVQQNRLYLPNCLFCSTESPLSDKLFILFNRIAFSLPNCLFCVSRQKKKIASQDGRICQQLCFSAPLASNILPLPLKPTQRIIWGLSCPTGYIYISRFNIPWQGPSLETRGSSLRVVSQMSEAHVKKKQEWFFSHEETFRVDILAW